MEWNDDAILIANRRHGETSSIATVMSRTHGRYVALVRGGSGKTKRGMLQPGNQLHVQWRARLAEHLGSFTCELLTAYSADVMDAPLRLMALNAACAMTNAVLPERETHPAIYDGLLALLESLRGEDWPSVYVKWEIGLLGELGFGLDLSQCAATGVCDDLIYVSPKSGCAVSAEAGVPYKERLLPLPAFLRETGVAGSPREIADGLKLTGFFLTHHVFGDDERNQPDARARFAAAHLKSIEAVA